MFGLFKKKQEQPKPPKSEEPAGYFAYELRPLREIWERECYRLQNEDVSIKYSERNQSMQYREPDGNTLTVKFFPNEGMEVFYSRGADAPKGSELGEVMMLVYENGAKCYDTPERYDRECNKMGETLSAICDDYFSNREDIGVVNNGNHEMPKIRDTTKSGTDWEAIDKKFEKIEEELRRSELGLD